MDLLSCSGPPCSSIRSLGPFLSTQLCPSESLLKPSQAAPSLFQLHIRTPPTHRRSTVISFAPRLPLPAATKTGPNPRGSFPDCPSFGGTESLRKLLYSRCRGAPLIVFTPRPGFLTAPPFTSSSDKLLAVHHVSLRHGPSFAPTTEDLCGLSQSTSSPSDLTTAMIIGTKHIAKSR